MKSVWEPIPGFEGAYWLSKAGEVRNSSGLIMKSSKDSNGHDVIDLRRDGQRERVNITMLRKELFNQ